MNSAKIKSILSKKVYPHPALIVATGIFAVMLITAAVGIANYNSEINRQLSSFDATASTQTAINNPDSETKQPAHSSQASQDKSSASSGQAEHSDDNFSSLGTSGSTAQASAPSSPSAGSAQPQAPQYLNVNLSINGAFVGVISVKSGSSQCQVLSAALSQGKIHSLDMRYNSGLKSHAVYVINGIGDSSSVWWVYTVNERSVQGCSFVQARGGDNINWKYIKS